MLELRYYTCFPPLVVVVYATLACVVVAIFASAFFQNIVGEEPGKAVIQEYLRRRGYSPSPEAVGASAFKLQAYVKPSADEGLTSGAKKPSRVQKEASASNNQNSKVIDLLTQLGDE